MKLEVLAGVILMSATINARDMQHSKTLGSGQIYNHLTSSFYSYAEARVEYNDLSSDEREKVHSLYNEMITHFMNS